MNAIPDKPIKPAPGKREADADVHLTIDFEDDEPETAGRPQNVWDSDDADEPASVAPSGRGRERAAAGQKRAGSGGGVGDDAGTPEGSPGPDPARPGPSGTGHSTPDDPPAGGRRRSVGGVPAQLAGIEVTLSVEVGTHRLPLRDLLSVDPGQLFPLDRMTADPVSILVNGRPFARGEVVAIGDRFGVRLLEMLSSDAADAG